MKIFIVTKLIALTKACNSFGHDLNSVALIFLSISSAKWRSLFYVKVLRFAVPPAEGEYTNSILPFEL